MATILWVFNSFSSVLKGLNFGFSFASLINDTAITNAQRVTQAEDGKRASKITLTVNIPFAGNIVVI